MAVDHGSRYAGGVLARRAVSAAAMAVALASGGFACSYPASGTSASAHGSSPSTSGNPAPLPTGPEGSGHVGSSQELALQPDVTAISPSSGTGGELVTITGSALGGVTAVCFGVFPVRISGSAPITRSRYLVRQVPAPSASRSSCREAGPPSSRRAGSPISAPPRRVRRLRRPHRRAGQARPRIRPHERQG
jgi:hypothetical protein